jgi:hypothetical protein
LGSEVIYHAVSADGEEGPLTRSYECRGDSYPTATDSRRMPRL